MNERHISFPGTSRRRWLAAGVVGAVVVFAVLSPGLAATPEDSLVLHLKLDGDTQDSSPGARHGELLSTPLFEEDSPIKPGQAIALSSNEMGVSVPGSDALAANPFTLAYWVKPTAAQSGNYDRLTSRAGDQFETAIGASDLILAYYQGSWNRTGVALKLNEWAHVTWRNRGPGAQSFDLFVNGKLVFTGPGVPAGRPGAGLMNIGTRHSQVEGFEGLMDDIRLYGAALADGDIAALAIPSDTDGDSLPDWWETAYSFDPSDNGSVNAENGGAGDADQDGLPNAQEYAKGANPREADTDGDTLKDGEEVTHGTNPVLADSDFDGITDPDEILGGTNPVLADTDGDGLADGVEIQLGTNPLDPLSGPKPEETLVLHLKLDGDAQDSSLTGNHGGLLGTPMFIDENPFGVGQAIALNANDSGVNVPDNDTLAASAFTLAYWVKPTALQGGGLERFTGRSGYTFETAIGSQDAGPLTLSYYQGTWYSTRTNVTLNEWAHVAWRNSGPGPRGMDLFINGQLVYTGAGVPEGRLNSGFMNIGTAYNQIEGFEGYMDDVRLYNAPLRNSDIAALGTIPDTDSDGLPDWWEVANGLNPADNGSVNTDNGPAGDPDKDGLLNAEEYTRKTKAKEADTDADGIQDGVEVTRGTNPVVADTDNDGLSDGDEVLQGTDPLVVDTDGDTIPDGIEVEAGTNPLDPLSGPPPSAFLVLHLKFDSDTQDSSPAGNHGEILGAPEFVADSPVSGGQAISFLSNDSGVNVPGSDLLAANRFTLCYWVKPTSLQEGAGLERLTSRNNDRFETAIGNASGVGGAPDLTLSYYQGGGAWIRTMITLALDQWAHVAWRNRGSGPQDLDLFVNGQLRYTGVGVPADGPGNGLLHIGNRWNGIEGFEGRMDDVRLYRAPLKDQDIATLVGLSCTNIVRALDGAWVRLTFTSQPDRTYAVEHSPDLTPGSWTILTDTLPSSGTSTTYTNTTTGKLPQSFYRVRDTTP